MAHPRNFFADMNSSSSTDWQSLEKERQEQMRLFFDEKSSPEQVILARQKEQILRKQIDELRNNIALREWFSLTQKALQTKPDYLILSIGSYNAPEQICPPFAVELARQNKQIMIVNVDPNFESNMPQSDLKNITINYIGHGWNVNEWLLTKPMETCLKRKINIIVMWHCNPSIAPNILNFVYKNLSHLGLSLTAIASYHQDQPVIIINSNYLDSAMAESGGEKKKEFTALITSLWNKGFTLAEIQKKEPEVLLQCAKYGDIKTLATISAGDFHLDLETKSNPSKHFSK